MNARTLGPLRGRYSAILVATLTAFVLEPVFANERGIPWGLSAVTFLVLLGSLRALWSSRALLMTVGALGLCYLALEAAESVIAPSFGPILTDVFGMAFLAIISYGILADIFTRDEITADTVFGASAVYILLGLVFARAFLLVVYLQPEAFAVSDALTTELDREGWRGSGIMHYFSFVTLTTIGYGDISPVAPVARSLAAVEALIGQLFIAAVIARLVALYTTSHPHRERM